MSWWPSKLCVSVRGEFVEEFYSNGWRAGLLIKIRVFAGPQVVCSRLSGSFNLEERMLTSSICWGFWFCKDFKDIVMCIPRDRTRTLTYGCAFVSFLKNISFTYLAASGLRWAVQDLRSVMQDLSLRCTDSPVVTHRHGLSCSPACVMLASQAM